MSVPLIMRASQAQSAAMPYQLLICTSGKWPRHTGVGSPSIRHSTMATVERVTVALGENRVSDTPVIHPCSTDSFTADSYQAPVGTSVKFAAEAGSARPAHKVRAQVSAASRLFKWVHSL